MNFIRGIMTILRLRKIGVTESIHQGTSGIMFLIIQISLFVWNDIKMTNKVGHEFYTIMVKRRDGEVYCDLAKTNQYIYLTKEEAEEDFTYYSGFNHHIVKMVAYLDEDL